MSILRSIRTTVLVTTGLCILLVTPVSALENYQYTDTRTVEVGPDLEVMVKTISGDVEYVGSDAVTATVRITIDIRAGEVDEAERIRDELDVVVDGEQGFLDAHVDYPDDFWRAMQRAFGKGRSVSVSFAIEGPRAVNGELGSISGSVNLSYVDGDMEINTVSGDVEIQDVTGSSRAETVSGSIDARRSADPMHLNTVSGEITAGPCGASVYAHTVSGTVHLNDIGEDVEAGTISGDIILRGVRGSVTASTTSGDIDVEHESGDLDLSSNSGDIRARTESRDGDILANSMSGNVELILGPDVAGEILLSTFSGRIETDRDIKARRRSKRVVKGMMGDGDAYIDVNTFSGDIVIAEK